MTRADPQGWMRRLVATRARRATVVALALSVNLVLQSMNLLDVFDGAPIWVLIVVFAIQVLLLGVAMVVLVGNLRERRTRQHR